MTPENVVVIGIAAVVLVFILACMAVIRIVCCGTGNG